MLKWGGGQEMKFMNHTLYIARLLKSFSECPNGFQVIYIKSRIHDNIGFLRPQ